jgi:hypothetical protein
MSVAWPLMLVALSDPTTVRLLIEQLQHLRATVRAHHVAHTDDDGLADLKSAKVWKEMARGE